MQEMIPRCSQRLYCIVWQSCIVRSCAALYAYDEDAAAVVQSAADVLTKFYEENGLGLVQKAKQPFASTAGEAPPPPPPTWTEDYGGKTGESQGIVAVLGLIKSDIEKDIAKADAEEKESKEMYEASKTALTNEINDLNKAISEAKSTKADKESEVADTEDSKATKKGELKAKFEQLDGAAEGCEFFTINYPLRLKNRQIEMDGLEKAKAILSGAVFEEPKDLGSILSSKRAVASHKGEAPQGSTGPMREVGGVLLRRRGQLSQMRSSAFPKVRVSSPRIAACLSLRMLFKSSKLQSLGPSWQIRIRKLAVRAWIAGDSQFPKRERRDQAARSIISEILIIIVIIILIIIIVISN